MPLAWSSRRVPEAVAAETRQTQVRTYLLWMVSTLGLFLLFRNAGLYPIIFSDEYTFSQYSRLIPFSEASIPGYLYFFVYRTTNLCGAAFLDCARILNVIFFLAATPLIYLIAKRLTGEKTALLIAALSTLGPINSYTAYFMPESAYFLSFWAFTYLVLTVDATQTLSRWILAGVAFGLSALVKPHALFLLPALAVYFWIILHQAGGTGSTGFLVIRYVGFFLAALATKFVISYALGGITGLTLFGQAYSGYAPAPGLAHYLELTQLAFSNLKGHVAALCLLFSVPLAHLIMTSRLFLKRDVESRFPVNISLYVSLILLLLLAVVVVFTASVAGLGPDESNARLHMRYYNFAFPLLMMATASQLSNASIGGSKRWRAVIGSAVGAAACYAIYTRLNSFAPSFADSPELRGIMLNPKLFYMLSAVSLISLVTWIFAARSGARIFIYLFLPMSVGISTLYINQELRHRLVPDKFDNAGIFTKQFLPELDLSQVVVVGTEPGGLFRSLFYLDNVHASVQSIPKGAAYDLAQRPVGKEWVLIVGDHPLAADSYYKIAMNGFVLAHASGSNTVDFRGRGHWPGLLSGVSGLKAAEPGGTWSVGPVVEFEFNLPLPERFQVHLLARTHVPHIGKEFGARVGSSAVTFMLSEANEIKVLEFENPGRSKTLRMTVPSPISPQELGVGGDERTLGIGFTEMKIVPL